MGVSVIVKTRIGLSYLRLCSKDVINYIKKCLRLNV